MSGQIIPIVESILELLVVLISVKQLVLSLLRFTHIVSGTILYDGVDITKIPRKHLRQALTILPQESKLLSGTVGSNLDPSSEISTAVLSKALEACSGIASFQFRDRDREPEATADGDDQHPQPNRANGHSNSSGISLETVVEAKGENFSHGQRQVLSLCRALVRSSKLMLLDEATASMDYETDRRIQEVLRRELAAAGGDRTLVTIAHRLRTIADYDKVVVMAAGEVVECVIALVLSTCIPCLLS